MVMLELFCNAAAIAGGAYCGLVAARGATHALGRIMLRALNLPEDK